MKGFWLYLTFMGVFALAIWACLAFGRRLETGLDRQAPLPTKSTAPEAGPHAPEANAPSGGAWVEFKASLARNLAHPLAVLLIQMLVILVAARVSGILATRLGQPAVMGEIVAGICLGPSLLGLLLPEVSEFVFPVRSLPNLQLFSQLGLMLFMFIIGMELDLPTIRAKAHAAVVISHASIVVPYLLGVLLSLWLYGRFTPPGVSFVAFALFMGIAMSITAFPVLARIIQERGLAGSPLGTLALTCAAADDVTAWCILAAVVALIRAGTAANTLFLIGVLVAYVAVMIWLVKPLLARICAAAGPGLKLDRTRMAAIFFLLLCSAFFTELIGIHALFGAFLAGAVLPDMDGLKKRVAEKIQDLSLVVLLPLFFAFTGLRTHIGLLNSTELWLVCGAIVLVAITGKFGGSTIAARLSGQTWRDSCVIGLLMNTRGLMELVVLNLGYDMGILSPEIFSMMVLMALVTTFMAGPILSLITRSPATSYP